MPHKKVNSYDSLWLNELKKFLVEELKVDSSEEKICQILYQKLKQIDLLTTPKPVNFKISLFHLVHSCLKNFLLKLHKEKLATPYLYRTPENHLIDLRLFDQGFLLLIFIF